MGVSLVSPNMFAKVVAEGYEEYGLEKGEVVYVAGKVDAPIGKDNPYVFERLFSVCGYNDTGLELGERGLIVISGTSLEPLPEEENEALVEKLLKPEDDSVD